MRMRGQKILEGAKDFLKQQYRKRGLFYFLYRSSWDRGYPLLCAYSAHSIASASLSGQPLVHFIGDSHTDPYKFEPGFITHHVGRGTAHNLGKPVSSSGSGGQLWKVLSGINKKRDIVGLVFGEIDCRVHFHYQYLKHKRKITIEKLMAATLQNYGSVIKKIRGAGFRVFVVGVPPAARQKNIYGYPFYGNPQERSAISRKFNCMLAQWCMREQVPFIDICRFLSDKDGFLKKEFAADDVHANKLVVPHVRRELEKKFKISRCPH